MATYDHAETMNHMILALRNFALVSLIIPERDVQMAYQAMSSIDTLGPILDPSRYNVLLHNGSLEKQRQVIDLFVTTRDKLRSLFPDFKGMDL